MGHRTRRTDYKRIAAIALFVVAVAVGFAMIKDLL